MPPPSSASDFLELVNKSGLVSSRRLDAHLERWRGAGGLPAKPQRLAALLVKAGLLTTFQTGQLLRGRWRYLTLGRYRLLGLLGSGGMGSVFLAHDPFLGRRVAVKVLSPVRAENPSLLRQFFREARTLACLDHPNLVRAHDLNREGIYYFFVMEYLDGSSLQQIVQQHGPMDFTRAAHYVSQAARALQYLGKAGVVHRDIKPDNLLLDRRGTIKVLDLGLARMAQDREARPGKAGDDLGIFGTAEYIAPEQAWDSRAVDIRADIYSLGGTFYFLLTGRSPFEGGTVAEKLVGHQMRQPPPIQSLRPGAPEALTAVVEKMMAKAPNRRYQVPAGVTEALAPWTRVPISPPPPEEMPSSFPTASTAGRRFAFLSNPGGIARELADWDREGTAETPRPPQADLDAPTPRPRSTRLQEDQPVLLAAS